jgi:hypothetical protein
MLTKCNIYRDRQNYPEVILGAILMGENKYWILSNSPRLNGDRPENLHGFTYSWVVDGEPRFNCLSHDGIELFKPKLNNPKVGEVIITNKLFQKINNKSVVCKKKETTGEIKLNPDFIFHENMNNVILNLPSSDKSPNCFDLRKGEVTIKVENLDDLWYLSHIIDEDDFIKGKTLRKIKIV